MPDIWYSENLGKLHLWNQDEYHPRLLLSLDIPSYEICDEQKTLDPDNSRPEISTREISTLDNS